MLTPREQKTLKRLEAEMKVKAWKYILIYGLSFGVLLAITTAIVDAVTAGAPISGIFKKRIWINLATAPIAGVFFGYILRWLSTKQYAKLKAKEIES
ncbi:MAG: hypothetical protein AAB221_01380 [Bacteroidota bacterium]